MKQQTSRHRFLKFMGAQTAVTALLQAKGDPEKRSPRKDAPIFKSLTPQREDRLVLVEGRY